jgi:large subunit ribosomal protein L14
MIFKETMVDCIDNTGVKKIKCIKVLGNKSFCFAWFCDRWYYKICFTSQIVKKKKFPKKGEIFKVLLVRSKTGVFRQIGHHISAMNNAVVLCVKNRDRYRLAIELKGLFL